jgi:hypothetical protein
MEPAEVRLRFYNFPPQSSDTRVFQLPLVLDSKHQFPGLYSRPLRTGPGDVKKKQTEKQNKTNSLVDSHIRGLCGNANTNLIRSIFSGGGKSEKVEARI